MPSDRAQQLNQVGAAAVPAPAMAVPPPPPVPNGAVDLGDLVERFNRGYELGRAAGVAEGRRQATEGYDRDEEWTMRYRLNGTLTLGEDGGHVLDSREDAERHIDVWRRHYPDLTYTDVEYLRREVLSGPWEAAEQAKPTCTCPQHDVTTMGKEPGTETVKGYDPACPVCPNPYAEQDGGERG